MEHSSDMYENAPITRRNTPHNRCAETNYFAIVLNCQFIAEPAKGSLCKLAFFDRSPLGSEMIKQYHIRCFEPAAEPRYMTSA